MTIANGNSLYPRLPMASARRLMEQLRGLEPPALVNFGSAQHPQAAPAPVGGRPVTEYQLLGLQIAIRELAESFGFPNPISDQASFDRACATLIFSKMGIVPGDAASSEVWSFISLVLAPEVPFWRFPNAADERYLGGQRNTFQRLWWRASTVGPDLTIVPAGAMPFGEDDFVQLMERPTVSGNERLARAFYGAVLESDLDELGLTRSQLVRGLVMQIRARRSHIAIDALSEDQLTNLIRVARAHL